MACGAARGPRWGALAVVLLALALAQCSAVVAARPAAGGGQHGDAKLLYDYYTGKYPPPANHGKLTAQGVATGFPWAKPEWGQYRLRGVALGINIWAWDVVPNEAIARAQAIVSNMLGSTPAAVLKAMVANRAEVSVIGTSQLTTDIPAHHYLANVSTFDGRNFNTGTRGVGGILAVPMASMAEENVMDTDKMYYAESIAVHEFGHSVMNLGLVACQLAAVRGAYVASRASKIGYATTQYMFANEFEYWGVGTQAWFGALRRDDTASGLTTRLRVWQTDAALTAVLYMAYGFNPWRYTDDCPRCRTTWPATRVQPPTGFVQIPTVSACWPVLPLKFSDAIIDSSTCKDRSTSCAAWQLTGECTKNPAYMIGGGASQGMCLSSCGRCAARPDPCVDQNGNCASWAKSGLCLKKPDMDYMVGVQYGSSSYNPGNCMRSCGKC